MVGGGGWVVGGNENNANSAQWGLKTELDNFRVSLNKVLYGFAKDIKPPRFHSFKVYLTYIFVNNWSYFLSIDLY